MNIDGNLKGNIQTLYCTECGKMLEFEIKPEKNGELIIVCDHCGHKHCRIVENGIVTSERWSTRSHYDVLNKKKFGVMRNANK
jgi:NAD-dependent SIR2 family protein deacetylase